MKSLIEKSEFAHPIAESFYKTFVNDGGLPHRRTEGYQFSKIQTWFKQDWQANTTPSLPSQEKNTIYIGNNGSIIQSDIELKKIEFSDVDFSKFNQTSLKQLNLGHVESLYEVELNSSEPITLKYLSHAKSFQSSFIQFIVNSDSTIIEDFSAIENESLTSTSIHAIINSGKLNYLRLDYLPENSALFSYPHFSLMKSESSLSIKQFVIGSSHQRFAPSICIFDKDSTVEFKTFFHLTNQAHFDLAAKISHLAPTTFSDQEVIGILEDDSKVTFTGRIYIDHQCSGVEANQFNKNIIIGKKAQALSQPQLEIFNDDVKCSHGSTTGQISTEELFYLQARGISKERATQIMMNSLSQKFFAEIESKEFIADCKSAYTTYLEGK